MSLKRHISRLSIASISPLCVFSLRFLRTVLLSHLLAPNHLGAAVALMSILAGCEMITDVGLDRFVVVTHGTDRAQAVAAARQIAIGRAIVLGAAIAIFSPALASVFGASEQLKGVAWLGLVPLIASFRNWRVVQLMQDYRYGPDTIANVSAQVAAVIVVFPAIAWFHDERALLVSLITEAAVGMALSHVLAERERVATVDPAVRKAAFRWGLPLMINGMGLMALKQLDQIIVANLFDLQTLALYALGLNLAITPTSPLQAIAQKVSFPFLGNLRDSPKASSQGALLVMLAVACAAAGYALPIGLALDRLVPFLYGQQYQVSELFCALAMLAAFLRFCRCGPNTILLYHSMTRRLTVGNLVAGVGMMFGLALGAWSRRIEGVIAGLVIGDLISLVVFLWLLQRQLQVKTAMAHIGVLTIPIGSAALVLWAHGNLTLGERALIAFVGGAVISLDALIVYYQVGRKVAMRAEQLVQRAPLSVSP
jgi:O-antigen/teichoic acid export membrane protein